MNKPYMTVGEVAIYLDMSQKWVYGRIKTLPGAFKLGGRWFIDRQILESTLKTLAAQPTKRKARPIISDDRHGLT